MRHSLIAAAMLLAVAGGNAQAQNNDTQAQQHTPLNGDLQPQTPEADLLQMVSDQAVTTASISAKVKITITAGDQEFSVAGTLRMLKDDVIRLQLTPFGLMEAARMEFTQDGVLIVDRINKEYIRASYSEVDFLQESGLDFFALQALFWNTLIDDIDPAIAAEAKVINGLRHQLSVSDTAITLRRGNTLYSWLTDPQTHQIQSVSVAYGYGDNAPTAHCRYGSFKALGAKLFPHDISLSLPSDIFDDSEALNMRITMSSISTAADWERRTTLSSTYQPATAETILNKLMSM